MADRDVVAGTMLVVLREVVRVLGGFDDPLDADVQMATRAVRERFAVVSQSLCTVVSFSGCGRILEVV